MLLQYWNYVYDVYATKVWMEMWPGWEVRPQQSADISWPIGMENDLDLAMACEAIYARSQWETHMGHMRGYMYP